VEVEPRFDRRREAGERIDLLNLLRADPFVGKQPTERLWSLSHSRAWQLIKGIMAHAEIAPGPHATPKGLRDGFDLHAIRSGVPLNLVQRWLGHARMETTAIYLQARPFNSSRLFLRSSAMMPCNCRDIRLRMSRRTASTPGNASPLPSFCSASLVLTLIQRATAKTSPWMSSATRPRRSPFARK
jgi:hypothetical protein